MTTMSGKQRLLTAINHEEPDRVPISPRMHIWLQSELASDSLRTQLDHFPDMDPMYTVPASPPNIIDSYPESYDIPQVRVEQKKEQEGPFVIVQRTFHTPAGKLSDRTCIPPPGQEFGVDPTPVKREYLVKRPEDLDALQYVLIDTGADYEHLRAFQTQMGERGVVMVVVRSALDHNAGFARSLEDLMVDFYTNRRFFDALLDLFHQRSLARIKGALEQGAEFIFGSWYFSSLSAGWSPQIFRDVFVPQIRDHVDLTHSYGAYYDYYDDGKLSDTMGWISEAGVDVLETCTPPPTGDFDLSAAKTQIGERTTLKGYVDLLHVLRNGTAQKVVQAVREAMAIGKPGGGFIIGSSDSFRDGTPRENIDAYFRACKKYGRYR
jgi:uroporphyrinogen decarboxylase